MKIYLSYNLYKTDKRIIIDCFQCLHHLTNGKVQLLYDELNK